MSNTNGNTSAPAGWHPDPSGAPQQRWWDGTRWTEHTQPHPAQHGQPTQQGQPAQPHAAAAAPTQPQPQPQPQPQYGQPAPAPYGQHTQPQYGQSAQPHYGQAYPGQPTPLYAAQTPPPVAPGTPVYNVFIWILTLLPLVSLLTLPLSLSSIEQSVDTRYGYGYGYGSASYLGTQALVTLISWLIYGAGVVLAYFDRKWLLRQGYVQPFHWAWAFLSLVYPIGRSVVVRRRSGRGIAPMWVAIGIAALSLVIGVVVFISVFTSVIGSSMTYGSYT